MRSAASTFDGVPTAIDTFAVLRPAGKPARTRSGLDVDAFSISVEGHEMQTFDAVLDFSELPPTVAAADEVATVMYDTCVSDTATKLLSGCNAFLIAYGNAGSGHSSTVWGPAASTDVNFEGGASGPQLGMLGHLLTQIFDAANDESHSERSTEMQLSVLEVRGTQVRDLLSHDDFTEAVIQTSSINQLPTIENARPVGVTSIHEAELHLMNALAQRHQDAACSVFLFFDLIQTTVGESAETGDIVTAVRASRFTMADLAAAPPDDISAKQLVEHPLHSFIKYVEAVVSSQAQQRRVLPLPSDNHCAALLLAPAFGGTAITSVIAIGDVSPRSSSADVFEFVSGMKHIVNQVKPNGGAVDNVVASMSAELDRLRKLLDASEASPSSNTKMKLSGEIHEKEEMLQQLQATTDRAITRYEEALDKLDDAEKQTVTAKKERDVATEHRRRSEIELSVGKQKTFAAAFRNAFRVKNQQKICSAEAQEQLEAEKERANSLQIQLKASAEERERSEFDREKTQCEVKRLQEVVNELNAKLSKTTRDLHDSQDRAEDLATKLNLAKFESTKETHDLRREVAALEQKRDHQALDIDALRKENARLLDDVDRRIDEGTQSIRDQLTSARDSIRSAQQETRDQANLVREAELSVMKSNRRANEMETENKHLHNEVRKLNQQIEGCRLKETERVGRLKEQHSIEREGYLGLLTEGTDLVGELRKMERCVIERPSLYRSGWPGVVSWLQVHGLGQYQSAFEHHGFTDMYAVCHIREEDLVEMKMLRGTRRKVIAAAERVRVDLLDVLTPDQAGEHGLSDGAARTELPAPTSGTDQPPRSQSPGSTAKGLIAELTTWVSDFRTSIKAEVEAAERV